MISTRLASNTAIGLPAMTASDSTMPKGVLSDSTVGTVARADKRMRRLGFGAIPGTSKLGHAHDNIQAAWLDLEALEMAELDQLAGGSTLSH